MILVSVADGFVITSTCIENFLLRTRQRDFFIFFLKRIWSLEALNSKLNVFLLGSNNGEFKFQEHPALYDAGSRSVSSPGK